MSIQYSNQQVEAVAAEIRKDINWQHKVVAAYCAQSQWGSTGDPNQDWHNNIGTFIVVQELASVQAVDLAKPHDPERGMRFLQAVEGLQHMTLDDQASLALIRVAWVMRQLNQTDSKEGVIRWFAVGREEDNRPFLGVLSDAADGDPEQLLKDAVHLPFWAREYLSELTRRLQILATSTGG